MTPLTEDEAWANYDRLVKDGATGQYLDETRAAIRAALRDTPVADTADDPEHVHEGRWCHACVKHGSDVTFAGIAEAESVRLAVADTAGIEPERTRLRAALIHVITRCHKFTATCDACWWARELVRDALGSE